MRSDMAQLLVERPRLYRVETYRGHRRRLNRDPESAPRNQGMRRPYFERKHFNEYFAPVVGFLRKNCGRPWDKVFSELSGSLSGGGTVIDHVKVHVLRDFVTLKPVWHRGVPCYPYHSNSSSTREEPKPIDGRFNRGFYVDRQGLLQRAKRHKRGKPQHLKVQRIPIDDSTAYHKLDGAWFRVWSKPLLVAIAGPDSVPVYDVVLKKWVKCQGISNYFHPEPVWTWYVEGARDTRELQASHGSDRIAYRKEQISNRTIRKEKLNERLR